MNGFDYYKLAFQKYADFSGRSRRSEYWYFVLFNALISWALLFLGGVIGEVVGLALYGIYALAAIIPSLAVLVRRLHDTGRSGWWFLIAFIPLVGGILLIVWLATDGVGEQNRWGSNPKYGYGEGGDVTDHLVDDDLV